MIQWQQRQEQSQTGRNQFLRPHRACHLYDSSTFRGQGRRRKQENEPAELHIMSALSLEVTQSRVATTSTITATHITHPRNRKPSPKVHSTLGTQANTKLAMNVIRRQHLPISSDIAAGGCSLCSCAKVLQANFWIQHKQRKGLLEKCHLFPLWTLTK